MLGANGDCIDFPRKELLAPWVRMDILAVDAITRVWVPDQLNKQQQSARVSRSKAPPPLHHHHIAPSVSRIVGLDPPQILLIPSSLQQAVAAPQSGIPHRPLVRTPPGKQAPGTKGPGMPNYGKFLKELVSNKQKLEQISSAFLNDECSPIIQNKVPPKHGDPESFLIPCTFSKTFSCNALADLGASTNDTAQIVDFVLYSEVGLTCEKDRTPNDDSKKGLGPNGESGGKLVEGFEEKVGSCGGNGGRGSSIDGKGGGLLAIRTMVSKDGLGGGGFVVLGGRSSSESKRECLDGWVRADGGEVKGGGDDFGTRRILLGEIPRVIIGESGGETFRDDGGAD
ncbi:hypothetical protein Tco_1293910 [Tanacetum coccineum]